MIVCPDMSRKLRFQVHYGDGYISHDAYGVDLSAFERRECGIDKPLERSFGSIRKWFHEIFNVNPKTHFLTVQTVGRPAAGRPGIFMLISESKIYFCKKRK